MRHDVAATPLPESTGREIAPLQIAGEPLDAHGGLVSSLPRDHPAWQRDVVSISARAREIIARLRPLAIRALTFWDHLRRSAAIGGRTLEIDPSGSYRLR